MSSARLVLLITVGALSALTGCYGRQVVQEPINVERTRQRVEAIESRQESLWVRLEHVDESLRSQELMLRAQRADEATRFEEIRQALDILREQMEGLNALAASGGGWPTHSSSASEDWKPGSGSRMAVPAGEDAGAQSATYRAAQPEGQPPSEEQGITRPAGEAEPGLHLPPPGVDGKRLYDAAYLDLTRGNFQLALIGFRDFLQRYPRTDLSDNAQYWIGECHYVQGQYGAAINEFLKVRDNYADQDKVGAALLKIAYSFRALGDKAAARRHLERLIEDYPGTEEFRLATEALRQLQ